MLRTTFVTVLAVAALGAAGCGRRPGPSPLAREEALLMRQVQGLEALVAAAEAGTLTSPDWVQIGIDEALIAELVAAGLPQERVILDRARVRLERAEISLRGSVGLVTLHGRVSPPDDPATFAELTLSGALGQFAIEGGVLRARVELIGFDVRRAAAAGVDSDALRALLVGLGEEGLAAAGELVPPLELPVRLEDVVRFEGLDDGPVRVAPASLPLRVSVARAMALSGRLWIFLDVKAGPWQSEAAR
jgi:hypothetical protein